MTNISLDWVADALSRFDILDLHITLSDLTDMPISGETLGEIAYYDTMALRAAESDSHSESQGVPLGKLVI